MPALLAWQTRISVSVDYATSWESGSAQAYQQNRPGCPCAEAALSAEGRCRSSHRDARVKKNVSQCVRRRHGLRAPPLLPLYGADPARTPSGIRSEVAYAAAEFHFHGHL